MKFIQRARRRRGQAGIYLVRTNRHYGAGRENGYAGQSNDVELRRLCHFGTCRHSNHHAKAWIDLDPRWYRVIPLPWWLSWKWVQAILEALVIWITLPRYNVQLNTKNPRYVPPSVQRLQRAARDSNRWQHRAAVRTAAIGRRAIQVLGAVLVLAGIGMTIWSNFA